jgi:LacI family transcriptional regulator
VVSLAPRGFGSIELVIDNELTGYEITKHLLALGHRQIAFLGGTFGLSSAEMRIAGYERAMSDAKCMTTVLGREGMTLEAGRHGAREAMAERDRPTAIIATNDELALGALAELLSLGFKVPTDVSVACVGGTRMTRAFELTHIALPITALGSLAAAYIAADGIMAAKDIELPATRLVHGRTSRSLR